MLSKIKNLKPSELCSHLYNAKYRYHDERDLQQGVAQLLDSLELEYEPEFPLTPRDRIDFLVGDIGIECKVAGSLSQIIRQLGRYVNSPRIKEIILLTTVSRHKNLPEQISSKPVFVVYLLRSFF